MLTSIRPFIVSSVDGAKKVSKNILLKISMKLSCRGCNGLNTSPLSERENVINCGQLEQLSSSQLEEYVYTQNPSTKHSTGCCRTSVLQEYHHLEVLKQREGDPVLAPQLHFPSRINSEFQFYIKCNDSVSLQLYLKEVLCLLFLDALKSISCDQCFSFSELPAF